MKYEEFNKKIIFDPLDMKNAQARYTNSIITSFSYFFWSVVEHKTIEKEINDKDGFNIPAGYISTSVEDIGKYLQGYLNENYDYLLQMTNKTINVSFPQEYGQRILKRLNCIRVRDASWKKWR